MPTDPASVVEHPAGQARVVSLERSEGLDDGRAGHLHLGSAVGAVSQRWTEPDGHHPGESNEASGHRLPASCPFVHRPEVG